MYTDLNFKRRAFEKSKAGDIISDFQIGILFLFTVGCFVTAYTSDTRSSSVLFFSVIGVLLGVFTFLFFLHRLVKPLNPIYKIFPLMKDGKEKLLKEMSRDEAIFTIYKEANFILNKDKEFQRIDHYTVTYGTEGIASKQTIQELAEFIFSKKPKNFILKTIQEASDYSLGSHHEVVTFPLKENDFFLFKKELDILKIKNS